MNKFLTPTFIMTNFELAFDEMPLAIDCEVSMNNTENNTEKTLFLLSKSKDEELSNSEIEELLTDLFFVFKGHNRLQFS